MKNQKEYFVNVYIMTDNFNVPAHINKVLNKESTNNNKYAFFLQNDIFANLIDKDKIFVEYVEFMKKWDLPYVMFPYYIHMNSVLPDLNNIPNPTLRLTINGNTTDVLNYPAYGFLGIDIQKLKNINFTFKETYPVMFYLQDLMEECYTNNLTLSNCCYLDIPHSNKFFKMHSTDGYHADINKFNEEKQVYHKTEYKYVTMNEFVEKFSKKYSVKKENDKPSVSPLVNPGDIAVLKM